MYICWPMGLLSYCGKTADIYCIYGLQQNKTTNVNLAKWGISISACTK
jgi:hypothetical protein